jgi:NADPH-dependent 2,4-dienoyl-CoA reductase/sulfur reductase-like enzyme
LPYDRTGLSKGIGGSGPGEIRNESSLENNGIFVLRESTVNSIDYQGKTVQIEGKESIKFDKLLIASGVKNRIPAISGLSNSTFFTLRNKQDYLGISEAVKKPDVKNVTIIGGGFIGM